ncbi:hypothetical protein HDV00_005418 [Rhizophlyctis rosea]|nr:hypothetical protein HDV00_005418 [Rhizophlyctis rosea]
MSTPAFSHIAHILVAEFDIDKGSSLTYQYPEETGTDPHMLAELMLPDGAHLREEDWTMFFLNQKIASDDPQPQLHTLPDQDEKLASKPMINLTLFELDSRNPSTSSDAWRTITASMQAILSFDEFSLGLWTDDGTSRLCDM